MKSAKAMMASLRSPTRTRDELAFLPAALEIVETPPSPIGRTIGNCLSAHSVARIGSAIGVQFAKRMVLLGEIVTAPELLASGFLHQIAEGDALDAAVDALCQRAIENAPLTTAATKAMLLRMRYAGLPDVEDLIGTVYGSADFRRGVATFLSGTKTLPSWMGE